MLRDELEQQLRAWGDATLGRHAANEDGPQSAAPHPIARAREAAPGKKQTEFVPVGRDGEERRRFMASRSGVKHLRILPLWAVSPISCVETRAKGPSASVDQGIPENLRWLDRAMLELYRQNPLRGVCLRMEYCGAGGQRDKAAAVARALDCELTLRQYRDELRLAREWMKGKVAA